MLLDDLERLLRLSTRHGHGEALIAWFEASGYAERAAPLVAAFKAYVRGERTLLDINPEVRGPASVILDRLSASARTHGVPVTNDKAKRRGRPPRG